MRHLLERAERYLSKEPENSAVAWIWLFAGGSLIFAAAVQLIVEGSANLVTYGLLAMGLALIARWLDARWLAEPSFAGRRGRVTTLRVAQWILAVAAVVLTALGVYFLLW